MKSVVSYMANIGILILSHGSISIHSLDLNSADGKRASMSLVVAPKDCRKFLIHIRTNKYPDFLFKTGSLKIQGVIIKKSVRVAESVDFTIISFDIRSALIVNKNRKRSVGNA